MNNRIVDLNFSTCRHVNYLWNNFVNKVGMEKAYRAVKQSIDLKRMKGTENTLPVLFIQTGGIALTTFELLRIQTGLSFNSKSNVLLYRPEKEEIQVLNEVRTEI